MIHGSLCVDSHVSEGIIKYLLLRFEMSYDVSIELRLQLKSNRFYICYVISYLRLAVLLTSFLSRLCYEILEYQLRFLLRSPTDSTIVRTYNGYFVQKKIYWILWGLYVYESVQMQYISYRYQRPKVSPRPLFYTDNYVLYPELLSRPLTREPPYWQNWNILLNRKGARKHNLFDVTDVSDLSLRKDSKYDMK